MKINHLLNRLFNLRTNESPRVLLLFLMAVLTNAGNIWALAILFTAVVQQVGVEALAWVIVLSSVLSIIASAIYAAFVDRFANDKLLVSIFSIEAVGIGLGLGLLWFDLPKIAYPFLYIWLLVLVVVISPHQVTYVNSFYDTQAAKRVLPIVSAGYRAGAILAGLTLPFLEAWFDYSIWFDQNTMIVFWLLTHIAVMGLILFMPYLLKEAETQGDLSDYNLLVAAKSSEKEYVSYLENMRDGFRYTFHSTYLRWMAVGTLLLMALMYLLEYRYGQLFQNVDNLSSFIAILSAVANIVALPIALFGLSRLITRWGLGNMSLLFPMGNLIVCGGLILAPGLVSAGAAFIDRTAFRLAIHDPIDGLLYNAVPLRVKGRARAFVGGLIVPMGSLLGGLLLFLPLISTDWFLPTLIGTLAVAYVASKLVIRKQYTQALVKMLEQEDFSFLLSQEASGLIVTDPTTLNYLQSKLEESPSPEFTIFMAQLISQVGGNQAVSILSTTARATPDPHTRATIVDVLAAANMQGDAVYQLYADFLTDPDEQVRQSAIAGLEQLVGPTDRQFISRMLEMIQDSDINVRVRALSALVHSGDFYQLTPAVQVLDQLLVDEDPQRRAYGVQVLGEIGYHRAIRNLLEYLTDPADEVRLEAMIAVETLSHNVLPHLKANGHIDMLVVEKVSPLLRDPIERVRRAALVILGRLASYESYPDLVEALTDSSPQVRATAADTLVQIGKAVIPIVHPELDSPDPQIRKMAAVILSRINRREFGPLVNANITGNLLVIYHNHNHLKALEIYDKYQSIAVLQNALRDHNQQLIDEIFYLLTAIHDPKAIGAINDSLASDAVRVRANATEALETLTSPETAQLIAPLFEPDLSPAQLLHHGKEAWDMIDPDPATTIKQLVGSETPWLRAIMVYALGEIARDLRTPETTDDPPPTAAAEPKRRQRQPADLLSVLDDIGDRKPKKERKPRRHRPADLLGALVHGPQVTTTQPDEEAETADQAVTLADMRTGTSRSPLTLPEIETILEQALADPVANVQFAAQVAKQMIAGQYRLDLAKKEDILLSVVEKIIFLKEVPFFQGMTVNQLEVLANVCEEELFEEDSQIFNQGDPGGVMYVIVNGKVGIEREGARKGSTVRLATLESHSYFGEMTLFDNSPRSAGALALQDTLILSLRREPLIALARQHPDLSLELINVLSQRLRESNDRIAELTRTRPRELQKLFDKLD